MKKQFVYFYFLLFLSCTRTNKESFVINKSVRGYILVVFNGYDKCKECDRKYTFSDTKIFFSDFEKKLGVIDEDVHLVGDGDSLKIPFIFKGQISGIDNSEFNKIHLVLLGGFSSKNVKTGEKLSLNLYWLGELSKLNQNDANRVISIIENNATMDNLKNNSIFSLIE